MFARKKSTQSVQAFLVALAVDVSERSAPSEARETLIAAYLEGAGRGEMGERFSLIATCAILDDVVPGVGVAVRSWVESGKPRGGLNLHLFQAGVPMNRADALAPRYRGLTFKQGGR